ncbi:MAG TPA: hypothetical protein VJ991_13920 [Balneolales bacterium]|nr:hypothetical protein [Balneolales bacterium]
MNLIVKMPANAEREIIVDAWVKVLVNPAEYKDFGKLIGKLIKTGHSHHGLTCYLLHEDTGKTIRNRVTEQTGNPDIEIALSSPICLN